MTIPVVVQMTVDSGTTYNLSADTNLQEIDLDNELEINVTQYTAPTYEGAYTVDAGLSAVTLETDGKVCTDDIVVNALTENTLSTDISINADTGAVTSIADVTAGYSPEGKATMTTTYLQTQSARTITPTTSEQTAVAKGKFTTGVVKVGAIPSQYADITGVTAQASDVLAGKYFVDNLGVLTLGTAIAGGGDGAPMPVDTVAEMIDTTKVYLYVGSEAGYTFGNWYYYDGNDWVSGGKWGADGGVNTNARNLLQYILERVAYTDTDMEIYVTALYEALAQAGAVTTTYTITNALSHVTNSNTATGCEAGDSYTGTLTADTNYAIYTVTVTMGGVDITSTAYSNGVITIASVTGDIVITASAVVAKYSWKLTDGDFFKQAGAISWDSTHDIYTNTSTYSIAGRRNIYTDTGAKPYYTTTDNTNFVVTNPPQYPIPVPPDATSCTYTVTPNTQFMGVRGLKFNSGTNMYENINDVGWKQGSHTLTFTAGAYDFLTMALKYNSAGTSYPTEPSEITITFNT